MSKIKAVVIDDEFFNRGLITMLIARLNPDFEVVGEAESVNEGYKLINEVKPDVIFLDIKMPDGSGFDLLKRFTAVNFETVFITGFDTYALQAFEHNALDYVLKPVDLDKFKQTLDRVQQRFNKTVPTLEQLRSSDPDFINSGVITKIPIHYNDKVILLPVDEIQYIQAKDEGTFFFKEENDKYSTSKPLSDFEFVLESFPNFVRINKNTYINANFVISYSKGMECYITLKNGAVMEISQRLKSDFIELTRIKKGN